MPGLILYPSALKILYISNSFVRSWQSSYNDPKDTSRDQLVSNIRACGYYKYNDILSLIFKSVLKNYSRFPNGDVAFINDYGRFIRSFRLLPLYPLLLICDLPLIVNSLIICFWLTRKPGAIRIYLASKFSWFFWLTNQYPPNAEGVPQSPYCPDNTSNDINFIGDLAQAKNIYPTPISYLSRKIYRYFRPNGIPYALGSYFSLASGGNVEFALLWKPIVEDF